MNAGTGKQSPFNFPAIKTTRTIDERVQKVYDELIEYQEAEGEEKDKEVIDVMHSVETLLRGHFAGRLKEMETVIKKVFIKNKSRGYYDEDCF